MINLGPLAHGDPLIRTATDSTLEALNAVIQLLRPGGRLTVILHPGDPTGRAETLAVRAWFDGQSTARFTIEEIRPPNAPDTASDVMVLTRVG